MKDKIVIIQRVFPNYRKFIFDFLSEKYNLLLLHSATSSNIPQVTNSYSKTVLSFNILGKETTLYLSVLPSIIKFKPEVIIHEFALGIVSLYVTFIYAKLSKTKFIIWGHGYDRKKGFSPNESILDKLRLWFMKRSNAIILYDQTTKLELKHWIEDEKIFVAQNTLDVNKLKGIKNDINEKSRSQLLKELDIKTNYNLVFIGRLLASKKPELLIDIFSKISNHFENDLGIHFVGEGEMINDIRNRIKSMPYSDNIKIYGSIHNDVFIGKLLMASDLLVNPGAMGLSIVQAFCFGRPVVTFANSGNGPFHGPEIEYVIHGETGILVENYDLDLMCDLITDFLNSRESHSKVFNKSIDDFVLNHLSIDRFVIGFDEAIDFSFDNKCFR